MMAEYLEREATIELYCQKCKGYYDGRCVYRGVCDVKVLEIAPAADVQPIRHGHWENEYLDGDIWWAKCSDCKEETHSRYGRVSTYRYCPNCGADMQNKENLDSVGGIA